jgi:small subunit ribosomal protein S15e
MADSQPKKRTFRRYTYKGIDLEDLVKLPRESFIKMLGSRQRRRLVGREVPHKYIRFYKKCVAAKKDVPLGEKPKAVKTHLRNAIILPELVGSVVGIYSGRAFIPVEIKPDMIGRYLAEFSITYKPVKHGRPGIGASKGSSAIELR